MELEGQVALITGANGVLGGTISIALGKAGATLILVDKHWSEGEFSILHKLRAIGIKYQYFTCDLSSLPERRKFMAEVHAAYQELNILVNNAAFVADSHLAGWNVPFFEQGTEVWSEVFELNVTAPFHLSQGLAPLMKKSCNASIVNIGSIYGMHAPDWSIYKGSDLNNPAGYAVSKAGLLQLTRWLATTLAPEIRVNHISLGGVVRGQPESFISAYSAKTPLGRMAQPDDLVGLLLLLTSSASSYITGQSIGVDGGWGLA